MPRLAASASAASSAMNAKNAGDWPTNRPMAVKKLSALLAASSVAVGLMIEQTGRLSLRKGHGSGMIRLVLKACPPKGGALRFGNTSPLVGSVRGTILPALSCQV